MRDTVTRRELLKSAAKSAATSAAVVGAASAVVGDTGCVGPQLGLTGSSSMHPGALAASLDPGAAEAVLSSLDARLSWIDEQELPEDVAPLSRLPHDAERERCRALIRKTARSLYATGRFIDLPDELKAHPDVQAKLRSLHGDMDAAVLGMTEVLERMSPENHRETQRCLREDPQFAERIAAYLERPALEDGIPFKRRFGMRASMLQLGSRMAAQSPALVTEPIVRKVRKIQARSRPEAEQLRVLASRMGQDAFWAHQEKMLALHSAWAQRLGRPNAMLAMAAVGGAEGVPPGSALQAGGAATVPATQGAAGGAAPLPVTQAAPTQPAQTQAAPTQPAPTQAAPTQPAPTQPAPIAAEPQVVGDAEPPPAPAPDQDADRPGDGTISTGATIMGFGAGSVVLGLGFWGLAEATSAQALIYPALFFGVTLGPILLAVGLVVLLIGLAIKAAA